jgi:A/G-specific adenine glycosylase
MWQHHEEIIIRNQMSSITRNGLQKSLLAWFDSCARALPWRIRPSLYGTWVSEIMLQQTTVVAVIPYWERFMNRFPDVSHLARAEESDVLALWSGLGYYRRAKNLHRAAGIIMNERDGVLPADRKQWQSLPGVGAYASGAIASIGLKEPVPAVDSNARRVLCRWFFDEPDLVSSLKPRSLEELGSGMVMASRPGDWNEAVMELGATLCRAKSPQCEQCPVLDFCRAGLAGVAEKIPPPREREQAIPIALATLVIRVDDQILLYPPGKTGLVLLPGQPELGRDDTSGLHEGLWSLPVTPWYVESPAISQDLDNDSFVVDWLKARLGSLGPGKIADVVMGRKFKHSITRYQMKVRVWEIRITKKGDLSPESPFPERSDELAALVFPKAKDGMHLVNLVPELPVSKLVEKSLAKSKDQNV